MKITKFIILKSIALIYSCPIIGQVYTEGQNIIIATASACELADIDGDNDLDLITTTNQTFSANKIWINNGCGNFVFHDAIGNSESWDIATGDLDNDGDIDLFIANATYNTISPLNANKVWINDGLGNFTTNGQSLGLRKSYSVTLADFDGDNDLDAFVGNRADSDSWNTVWLNDGTGQFIDSGQLLGNFETHSVESGDVDNDGDIDVIAANCCKSTLPDNGNIIWINNGNGIFATNGQSLGVKHSKDIALADFNGDSFLDIIFSNVYDSTDFYINDGSGNFIPFSHLYEAMACESTEYLDFDGDGDFDVIMGYINTIDSSHILINDGLGNFTINQKLKASETIDLVDGDIDNDGDIDLFEINLNSQAGRFWINMQNYNCPRDTIICPSDSIFLENNWVNSPGIYNDTLITALGGDSIVQTTLSIQPSINLTTTQISESLLEVSSGYNNYNWIDCSNDSIIPGENTSIFSPGYMSSFAAIASYNNCTYISPCVDFCKIYLGNDTTICKGDLLILDGSNLSESYLWQDGSTDSLYIVSNQGLYWINVEGSCIASDSIYVEYTECIVNLDMPNVFSPNNDGLNDSFGPFNISGIEQISLEIYNRWGVLMFKSNSIYHEWNGIYNSQKCPEGTYFYVLKYIDIKNTDTHATGFLNLMR